MTGLLSVCLLALTGTASAGIDVQHIQPLDGGAFPTLREADTGRPWTLAAAVSWTQAKDLLVLVQPPNRDTLIEQVLTQEMGVSANLGGHIRVGVALPIHLRGRISGEVARNLSGDVALWAAVPILRAPNRGTDLTLWTAADVGTGATEAFLGDEGGAASLILAGSRRAGFFEFLGNIGTRFQKEQELPGISWGSRWVWGAGVRAQPWGPLTATAEVQGSAPLRLLGSDLQPGLFPTEAIGTVGAQLPGGIGLAIGGGVGLGKGVGSPSSRLLAVVDMRPRQRLDTDRDGRDDRFDLCRERAEDLDDFRDWDGCPEPDNDNDGIRDVDDSCPLRPEVFNHYADQDGCPDQITRIQLVITSAEPSLLEVAEVRLGDLDAFSVLGGEGVLRELPGGGTAWLRVQAPNHHDVIRPLRLEDRDQVMVHVELQPIAVGEVRFHVTDPEGNPLHAAAQDLARLHAPHALGPDLAPLQLAAGSASFRVSARGYEEKRIDLQVLPGILSEVSVVLDPLIIAVAGRRITLRNEVRFELDSETLPESAPESLEPLVEYLLDNPAIELVRVEGHADEIGTSRYNYELSVRRSQAVVDYLVSRGISASRLAPVGAGEAIAQEHRDRGRTVGFLVLVWADQDVAIPGPGQ